ncbi:hypothetical protein Hdeb2414_s0074g00775071 [Helianthus debilis subsp. tardiflorus]
MVGKNYDHKTRVLNCGSYQKPITEELMHEIFGVPTGKVEIQEVERTRADFSEVVAEWKSQFENAPKRFTHVQFKTYIQPQHASGRIFVLNFLRFYNTLLGETTHNSSINIRFLPALRRGLDVNYSNWCEYIIRCLDRNVDGWLPKDCFHGPMALLVVCSEYIHTFVCTCLFLNTVGNHSYNT